MSNPLRLVANALTTRAGAPWLLDLFCGAGGAGMGYWQAGFNVLGVDIAPQPHYPFWFVQADALDFARRYGAVFDAIHASPPCQHWNTLNTTYRADHPALIAPTRQALRTLRKPFVIENIPAARRELVNPIKLCGSGFGLNVWRHRYFELNGFDILLVPPCQHTGVPTLISGVTRRGNDRVEHSADQCRSASGLYWMTRAEMDEAIPPAYTHFVGQQLMRAIKGNEVVV